MAENTLSGKVRRIIYHQDDYFVFTLQLMDGQKTVTVKGYFEQAIKPNAEITLLAEEVVDPKYGKQYQAEVCTNYIPQNVKELPKYLETISGIGKRFANQLAEKFGMEIFDIILNDPNRLQEIYGIGPQTVKKITADFKGDSTDSFVMMSIAQLDIPYKLAKYLFKICRKENKLDASQVKDVYEKLKEDPYKYIPKADGFTFAMADDIFLSEGGNPCSALRIQPGILEVLKHNNYQGNIYILKENLMRNCSKFLKVEEDVLAVPFEDGLQKKLFCQEDERVYLEKDYKDEMEIAERLLRLSGELDINVELNLENLDEVQSDAVKQIIGHKFTILTGGPGTGKTTTIKDVIRCLEEMGESVRLAAPTGRAAKRMTEATGKDASTIHRMLGCLGVDEFKRNEEMPLTENNFIIDEASMLDQSLMCHLLRAIPKKARLVLVGDVNQLPSVGAGNVLSDLIQSNAFPVIRLEKVYRQSEGSQIIYNAHRILKNEPLFLSNRCKDFFFKECNHPGQIQQMLVHYAVDSLPDFTGEKEVQILTSMKKGMLGTKEINAAMQARLNGDSPDFHGFRKGDKVIQIKNDYSREKNGPDNVMALGVFNGDCGVVKKIDYDAKIMKVLFDDGYTSLYSEKELGTLQLAYALTVHKSQGSEYPVVVIPVYDFVPVLTTMNLLYTAVTRAKKCILIIGSKDILDRIKANVWGKEQRLTTLELRCKKKQEERG